MGDDFSNEDAMKIVIEYFRSIAFDFDSIKLRNIQYGERQFFVWCSNPWLFGCLEYQIRAGKVVQFEVNGKNSDGGRTGFQNKTLLIRKSTQ